LNGIFKYLKGDKVLWMAFLLLCCISMIAVYSSIPTLANKRGGNTMFFLIRHATLVGLGALAAFVVHKIKFKYFSKLSVILLWVSIALLGLTLVFGVNINNASRWIMIPIINQGFQPSDLAKIVLIVWVARTIHLKKKEGVLDNFYLSTLQILFPVFIVFGLILPANFSTAVMIFITVLVIMFVGKVPIKHLSGIVIGGLLLVFSVLAIGSKFPEVFPRATTWAARIQNFESGDSKANFQVEQAKIAIASGGIIPKGPGKGNSRNFMPHPYSDMIYAFLIEEYGVILGGFGVLLLYLIIFFRTLKIAWTNENEFALLTAFGLGFGLIFQALINMAVSVNLIPVTGQPLPMISMGGTSSLFTGIAFGIILSISRTSEQEENIVEPANRVIKNEAIA
jgi:cell division protein FtsW